MARCIALRACGTEYMRLSAAKHPRISAQQNSVLLDTCPIILQSIVFVACGHIHDSNIGFVLCIKIVGPDLLYHPRIENGSCLSV